MEQLRSKYLARIRRLQDELFALGVKREEFDQEMPIEDLEEFGKATAEQLENRKKFLRK